MNDSTTTERLWQQFAAGVRGFLRNRLPNDAIADDLLQETFLRVHRKRTSLDDEQFARGWVYQIARNLVIDYYRGEGGRNVESVELQNAADASPDVSLEELHQRIAGWLLRTIDSLPDTCREATRLSAAEGLSQSEVALRLGISLEAARSRIRRGREQLKVSLNACCSFDIDGRGTVLDFQPKHTGPCCEDGSGTCS